jgi:hypothetical protein
VNRGWFVVFLLATSVAASAQSMDHRLTMVKVHERIVIEGTLDENAWGSAPMATNFVQQEPKEGMPMTYDPEVKILYDDENLYFGVKAHNPEAHRLVINPTPP